MLKDEGACARSMQHATEHAKQLPEWVKQSKWSCTCSQTRTVQLQWKILLDEYPEGTLRHWGSHCCSCNGGASQIGQKVTNLWPRLAHLAPDGFSNPSGTCGVLDPECRSRTTTGKTKNEPIAQSAHNFFNFILKIIISNFTTFVFNFLVRFTFYFFSQQCRNISRYICPFLC